MKSKRYKRFSISRVTTLSSRVFKQFTRDKRTFAMLIVFPIIFMLVFGVVLSGEVKHIPISVEVADEGISNPFTGESRIVGDEILASLESSEKVDVELKSYTEGVGLVEDTDLIAAILIPVNFTQDLIQTGNATIMIYVDGTKPQLKAVVYSALADALKDLSGGGIDFDEKFAFGVEEVTGFDAGIPAVMGYILTFLILLLAVLTAIREDVNHTKMRLFTTPITPIERVLGYVIALSFFTMIETVAVILVAVLFFKATIHGSLLLLFGAGMLYGIAHIFLAFVLANFSKNEFQSVQMAIFVAIPSLAMSGMLLPISTFPVYLRWISAAIPLTYGIRIFEGIMLRGWGIAELWLDFVVITLLTIGFFILALVSSSDISKD